MVKGLKIFEAGDTTTPQGESCIVLNKDSSQQLVKALEAALDSGKLKKNSKAYKLADEIASNLACW